ncbi:hypothetical protein [Promicromonospora sp. NPDC090134]|uniref:hypothetical protein n=1 Tax=Promicromonospora sp. NPDC090134 TaxID=3364408 RepID=UPI0038114A3F
MSLLPPLAVVLNGGPSAVDWMIAIGTLAAVLVALVFGGFEYYRGTADRREQATERRRAQATLVNAWLDVHIEPDPPRLLAEYRIHNASAAPVYEVVVSIPAGFMGDAPRLEPWGMLTPTDKPRVVEEPEVVHFVDDQDVQLELTFRDAAGLWWRRGTDGILHELPGNPHVTAPPAAG